MKIFDPPIDISVFLPHRAPFLMVDSVLSLDSESVVASFKIREACIFVENEALNEFGLIENAAQTCSSIVGRSYFDDDDDLMGAGNKLVGFISAIKKATILSLPQVGNEIISKAKLISRFDLSDYSICGIECNTYENDKLLISCEMTLFLQEMK